MHLICITPLLQNKGKDGKEGGSAVPERLLPAMPNLEAEPLTSSGEDLPMYFTHPQQLLDIFQALEEQNLFLIQVSQGGAVEKQVRLVLDSRHSLQHATSQNSQETEQALEELKQSFRETRAKMDAKTQALRENICELEQQIGAWLASRFAPLVRIDG